MAFKRLSMRKIHHVLRLFFEAGLSIRAIARSLQASPSTVGDYIRRAHTAGLSWPLPEKGRHIEALVAEWRRQGLADGTVKNRMAHLRWLAKKIGKPGIVRRDNASYGVGTRCAI